MANTGNKSIAPAWRQRWARTAVLLCSGFLINLNTVKECSAQKLDSVSINKLVEQLGHSEFQIRESAEKQILKVGAQAIECLRKATVDSDCEIRLRSRRLLTAVIQNDYERRLQQFLKSENVKDFQLALWPEFSQIAGTDLAARRLFIAMHKSEQTLFAAWQPASNSNKPLASAQTKAIDEVLNKLAKISGPAALPTLACAMLIKVKELDQLKTSEQTDSLGNIVAQITNHHSVIANCLDGETDRVRQLVMVSGEFPAYRRLITDWLKSISDSTVGKTIRMRIAARYELDEFASEVSKDLSNLEIPGEVRAAGIAFVGQALGQTQKTELLKRLEPLLSDQSVFATFETGISENHKIEVRMGDIALAALVFAAKQPFEDFGFKHHRGLSKKFISLAQAGFESDELREKAYKQWNTFRNNMHQDRQQQ